MEPAVIENISPVQLLLAFAIQVWIIVFPIIIIRKLNYITEILESSLEDIPPQEGEPPR